MTRRLIKFGSVGALGAVTNLSIYSILVFLDLNYNIAAAVAFVVAVTQNFILNKSWTFKDHDERIRKKFVKYFFLNFVSFLINLAILNLIIHYFGTEKIVQIIAQIIGIAGAMILNFTGSHLYVFGTLKDRKR